MLTKLLIYRQDEVIYSFAYSGAKLIFELSDSGAATEAIFMAKITRLHQANATAFVEYLPGLSGFINLPAKVKLQEGSLLAVQLTWLGDTRKQAKFRCGWQLVGKYVVYAASSPQQIKGRGLSATTTPLFAGYAQRYPGSWVLRSSVSGLTEVALVATEMAELYQRAALVQAATLLGQASPGTANYLKLLRSLPLAADCEVITNDPLINQQLLAKQQLWQIAAITLDSSLDLAALVRDSQCHNSLVTLASGASLEIHTLAGLNIIDINSDKLKIKSSSLNFVVLDDVYQQICLRNLQGIILIDFVKNMSPPEHGKIVNYLQKLFNYDVTNTVVLGFTNAGLCELIRNKF